MLEAIVYDQVSVRKTEINWMEIMNKQFLCKVMFWVLFFQSCFINFIKIDINRLLLLTYKIELKIILHFYLLFFQSNFGLLYSTNGIQKKFNI